MKMIFILLMLTLLLASCKNTKPKNEDIMTDNNFKVESNSDFLAEQGFSKLVKVFDIPIYAVTKVNNIKLLHAANVMAQYLDNNADGIIDNLLVHSKMIENGAFMVMWKSEDDLEIDIPEVGIGQDLGDDETNPNFVLNGNEGRFDASLEEVLHIITHAGYASVYPDVFGEESGSLIADAMDIARGGHFEEIPNQYPETAWYSYYDETCEYECMITEYMYWGLTSILGAQQNRLDEIGDEWKLNTNSKVQETDANLYQLLTNPIYKLPTILPDGKYTPISE